MIVSKKELVLTKFRQSYGQEDFIVKAPGRANIIGEHVDYADGLVLPFAIEKAMYLVGSRNDSDEIEVCSLDFDQQLIINESVNSSKWGSYLLNVVHSVKRRNLTFGGASIMISSDIPIGAGLSSSSSLCCGFIALLNALNQWGLNEYEMIEIASEAEYGMGLQGGKMDQTVIFYGKANCAYLLDCKTGIGEHIELAEQFRFWILDSGVSHNLIDSEYNQRRGELEDALEIYNRLNGQNLSFRELDPVQIESSESLNDIHKSRLRHVVSEILRVKESIDFIRNHDIIALSDAIDGSHESLRDDYEVSCPEIDFLQSELIKLDDVYAARIMGGGFGGSLILLCSKRFDVQLIKELSESYNQRFNIKTRLFEVKPSNGITIEPRGERTK